MTTAASLIERHALAPHPEGGWYRETHRSDLLLPQAALPVEYPSDRCAVTSILYLLQAGEHSKRHRVRSEELWLHQGGDPLRLTIEAPDGSARADIVLGAEDGVHMQCVVPALWWQSAELHANEHGYALMGCVVAPGFEFEDFEVAE